MKSIRRLPCICAAIALIVAALPSCGEHGYGVAVRFEPTSLGDAVQAVEVAIVPSCDGQTLGLPAADPVRVVVVKRGMASAALGEIPPGQYGLYGVGRSASCGVVAAGCDPVTFEAGGHGEVVVTLRAATGPGCPVGSACESGACTSGFDASVDAAIDAPVTCSEGTACDDGDDCTIGDHCESGACASGTRLACDDGVPCTVDSCAAGACSHAPNDALCTAAAEGRCDALSGCQYATCTAATCVPTGCYDATCVGDTCMRSLRCGAGQECCADACVATGCDDTSPCTVDVCGASGCSNVIVDGAACPGGVCRGGACCAGCWNGASCAGGTALGECGAMGATCASCDDSQPCTDDACTAGACAHTNDDTNPCSGGLCHAGACCTGCWDGVACRSGTTGAGCGVAGGACTTCSCPRNTCSAGACVLGQQVSVLGPGAYFSCVVTAARTLMCWGDNTLGELGLGDAGLGTERLMPTQVGTATNWAQVDGGTQFTCAVNTLGELWCWGENDHGQLGLGDTVPRQLPTRVGTMTRFATPTLGHDWGAVLGTGGELYVVGENALGQLGTGDRVEHRTIVARTDGPWTRVSAGYYHGCAIRTSDRALYCWGSNVYGQVGAGDSGPVTDHPTPVRVGTGAWLDVACGQEHTCAVDSAGGLWCWGRNADGELGIGTSDTLAHSSPLRVGVAATTWATVWRSGQHFSCATRTDGTLWCWGQCSHHQCGASGTSDRLTPLQVGTDRDWVAVALGENFGCATKPDGGLWCWGENNLGQLGFADRLDRILPTQVCFP